MANEIASAYVTLLVKMDNPKKRIESGLAEADAEGAGAKIADGVGKGISTKQAAIAGAFGGVFAVIANSAATALGDLIGDAVAQSDATQKFAKSLDFAGLDTTAVENAVAASKSYADSTVYDLTTIQKTTAALASNGVSNYSELTEAAGNLNAVAGGSASSFDSFAMMLGQTSAAGKLTTENWNQLTDAVQGASGPLQTALKNSGAYVGDFREAMANGEISADEFNAAILQLGTQPVAVEAAASVETMEGAVGNLSASITGVLADAFTTIKPFITAVISGFADFISNSEIFLPIIGGLATAIGVVLAPAIWTAATAVGGLTLALLTSPITWIILGITALVASIIWLANHWDQVTAFVTDVWAGFISWITGVLEGFVGWWNGIWAAVGAWIAAVWNTIVAVVQGAWNAYVSFIMGAVNGFLGWWNGIWKALGDGWNALWNGLGNVVKGIWDGIVNGIKWYINTIISLINGVINGVNVLIGGAGAVIGLDLKIPTIPKLAQGGIVSASSGGTLAVIGEGGRDEAVIPLPDDWKQSGLGGQGLTRDDLRAFAAEIVAGIQGLRSSDARASEFSAMRGYAGGV